MNKRDHLTSLSQIDDETGMEIAPSQKMTKISDGTKNSSHQQHRGKGNHNDSALQEILEARKYLHIFLDQIGNRKQQKQNKSELKEILKYQFEPIQTYEQFINLYENDIQKMVTNRQTKKNWNKDDILLLVWIVQQYCSFNKIPLKSISENDWEEIAKIMPGKSVDSCKFKWLSMKKSNVSLSPWTQTEDQILLEIVQEKGPQWVEVSKILFEEMQQINKDNTVYRTSKQCREHYNNFLDPNLKRTKWTEDEDQLLIRLQARHGNKWSIISKQIPGRTDNSVKNRFMTIKNKIQNYSTINTPIQELDEPSENTHSQNNYQDTYDDDIDNENENCNSNIDRDGYNNKDLQRTQFENTDPQFFITKEEYNPSLDSHNLDDKRNFQKSRIEELNINIADKDQYLKQEQDQMTLEDNNLLIKNNCDILNQSNTIKQNSTYNKNGNEQKQSNSLFQQGQQNLFCGQDLNFQQYDNQTGQFNNCPTNNIYDDQNNYLIKQMSNMEISPTAPQQRYNQNLISTIVDIQNKIIYIPDEQWDQQNLNKQEQFIFQPLSEKQKKQYSQQIEQNKNNENPRKLLQNIQRQTSILIETPEQQQLQHEQDQNINHNQKQGQSLSQITSVHPVEQMMVGFPLRSFEYILEEERSPGKKRSQFFNPQGHEFNGNGQMHNQSQKNFFPNLNQQTQNQNINNQKQNRSSLWFIDQTQNSNYQVPVNQNQYALNNSSNFNQGNLYLNQQNLNGSNDNNNLIIQQQNQQSLSNVDTINQNQSQYNNIQQPSIQCINNFQKGPSQIDFAQSSFINSGSKIDLQSPQKGQSKQLIMDNYYNNIMNNNSHVLNQKGFGSKKNIYQIMRSGSGLQEFQSQNTINNSSIDNVMENNQNLGNQKKDKYFKRNVGQNRFSNGGINMENYNDNNILQDQIKESNEEQNYMSNNFVFNQSQYLNGQDTNQQNNLMLNNDKIKNQDN